MIKYILQNRAHYIREIIVIIDRAFCTVWLYIRAMRWGIKIGRHCRASGAVHFNRRQDSNIIIGSECVFQSRPTSNSMGLFCPCMLTTTHKGAIISIGDNCGFSGTRIRAAQSVTIRDNVRCGANVLITDTDAHTDDPRAGRDAPVVIDENVWIGMNVIVLKGVHIGQNSVIGAGSIVTNDIPANVVAAGNPCKVIKNLKV